jgi:glutathione S-transferase
MSEYRLYGFAQSGNSYKAAMILELCGLDWSPAAVDYFAGETRSADWRAEVNEMGEVPVLAHGALRITQSGVILDYLAERTGLFAPRDAAEQREVWRWILFDNHKFTADFAKLRFQSLLGTPDSPIAAFMRPRVEDAYGIVDRHLAGRAFLLGDRPTIADLSLAGYVFYDEPVGIDFTRFAAIEAWKTRIRALPRWRAPYDLLPAAVHK